MIVDRITKLHFGFHFITFSDGDKTHVVAKPDEPRTLPVVPCSSSATPRVDAFQYVRILPVTHYHFSFEIHPRCDEAKLAVPMGRLVQVHKIHIDGRPGDVAVILCMQM